jgi:hypothetical protein
MLLMNRHKLAATTSNEFSDRQGRRLEPENVVCDQHLSTINKTIVHIDHMTTSRHRRRSVSMGNLLRALSVSFLTLAIVQAIRRRRMNDSGLLVLWRPSSIKCLSKQK